MICQLEKHDVVTEKIEHRSASVSASKRPQSKEKTLQRSGSAAKTVTKQNNAKQLKEQ